jgi:hypothetical protein
MIEKPLEYRMIVLCRRLRIPGVLQTMGDQIPEIQGALAGIVEEELAQALASLGDGGGWSVHSHSVTVHNGLLIASFLACRSSLS